MPKKKAEEVTKENLMVHKQARSKWDEQYMPQIDNLLNHGMCHLNNMIRVFSKQ